MTGKGSSTAQFLILRLFKSTPTVALEAELGILPVDIRLQELKQNGMLERF